MWSKKTIKEGYTYHWQLGQKHIALQKTELMWQYVIEDRDRPSDSITFSEEKTEATEIEWKSTIGDKSNLLQLLPALPDMPLVIKPAKAFSILPGKSALLYLPIPLWLQFYADNKKKEHLIFECSAEKLSQTWFGEPSNGQLAYSWSIDLSKTLTLPDQLERFVICPVRVNNESGSILDLQRLLLQCEYLKIYAKDQTLFTNEIKIGFRGENDASEVQYINRAPAFIKDKMLLNGSRSTKTSNVISKSFHFIKSLSNS